MNQGTIDLEIKIDALKEELKPRIDKVREKLDELKV